MSIVKRAAGTAAAAVLALSAPFADAEPTSGAVTISQLRPYIGGTSVYVYVNGVGPCGSGVSGAYAIYTIDLSSASGKAAYAAALAAVIANKSVLLEVIAGACGTQYPGLQSVYALPN